MRCLQGGARLECPAEVLREDHEVQTLLVSAPLSLPTAWPSPPAQALCVHVKFVKEYQVISTFNPKVEHSYFIPFLRKWDGSSEF